MATDMVYRLEHRNLVLTPQTVRSSVARDAGADDRDFHDCRSFEPLRIAAGTERRLQMSPVSASPRSR